MKISLTAARRMALHCQGLDGTWQLPSGKEGVAQVIQRLGYVQIDSIHVIQRAHHHVLWTRWPGYQPRLLHTLQAQDRRVFEWWTHAASYIPTSDFRFYAPRMGEHALSPGREIWIAEHQDIMEHVLSRIQAEGALGTADFKAPEGFEGGSWWSGWKPAKRALEVFFNLGVLLVSERRSFQRIYDLRERIIPDGADQPLPDTGETEAFIIRRALGSLGALPAAEIRWWGSEQPSEDALQRAVDERWIVPLEVEAQADTPWYALRTTFDMISQSTTPPPSQLHILSPFDNLIIRRQWMERLFEGFDYRLECYLPQEKRQYGYFALPILWGQRFIARIDTKADRKRRTLIVRQLTFEPDFTDYDAILPRLAEKLWAFAAFNACDTFSVEQVVPAPLRRPLMNQLLTSEPAASDTLKEVSG